MSTVRFWGRWLAVIPAALLGAVLVSFPIHWVVLGTFAGDDSFIQLSADGLATAERLGLALIGPAAFVTLGAWAAPRFKFETTLGLAGFLLLVLGLTYGYAVFSPQSRITIDAPMVVLNLIGTTGAVVQAWMTRRREVDNGVVETKQPGGASPP